MLIVEALTIDGLAAQAGLCVEDCLLAYNDRPLTSPALLQALSENAAIADLNSLQVSRHGAEITFSVPSGALGMEAHPVLSEEVLALYRQGEAAWQAENREEASRLWRAAILRVSEPAVAMWLEMCLGSRYEQQRAFAEAL